MKSKLSNLVAKTGEVTTQRSSQRGESYRHVMMLNDNEREILCSYAQIESYAPGIPIIRRGLRDSCFHLLLSGDAVFERNVSNELEMPSVTEWLNVGELFGLLAFFTEQEHPRSVISRGKCEVATVSQQSYLNLLEEEPDLWQHLQLMGTYHMRKQRLAKHLDKLFGPFGAMLPYVVTDIENEVEWKTLLSGETLFVQGRQAKAFYILVTGRLQMTTRLTDGRLLANEVVVPGETVGETALLTEQSHSHSVYAARESEIVTLSNNGLELMLRRNTRAIHNITRILGKRLSRAHSNKDKSTSLVQCISLLHANDKTDIDKFSVRLQQQLSLFGNCEMLSSHTVDEQLSSPNISQRANNEAASLRLTEWLYKKEENNQFLVYQSDKKWSNWNKCCIRQTEQIVVVASARAKPDLSSLKHVLSKDKQRWSLVLLHDEGVDRPRNTSMWFETCDPNEVYHVRDNNLEDIARLARILSGNGVSLVLGGGGARGFAHLGVIKALKELNVPVDFICGTSMGAPIAGMIAQGAEPDEVARRSKRAYHKIIDVTLPLVSLLAGKRISRTIKEQTLGWDIEDYWLPFFCVSTNLTTALSVVHQRGDSWLAIRSSVSIPGVLPPVPFGDHLLVDGGVLNNLPVDIMREFNPHGTIIAVDVVPPLGLKAKSDYGTDLSGWKQLFRQLVPWLKSPSVPSMASTIMQSMVAGSALKRQQILEQKQADLYLNIHVKGVGMMQFDALERAKQIGYDISLPKFKEFFPKHIEDPFHEK